MILIEYFLRCTSIHHFHSSFFCRVGLMIFTNVYLDLLIFWLCWIFQFSSHSNTPDSIEWDHFLVDYYWSIFLSSDHFYQIGFWFINLLAILNFWIFIPWDNNSCVKFEFVVLPLWRLWVSMFFVWSIELYHFFHLFVVSPTCFVVSTMFSCVMSCSSLFFLLRFVALVTMFSCVMTCRSLFFLLRFVSRCFFLILFFNQMFQYGNNKCHFIFLFVLLWRCLFIIVNIINKCRVAAGVSQYVLFMFWFV